jgi:hypothetical protein
MNPKVFSQEQINQFIERGHVTLSGAFDPQQALEA